MVAGLGGPGRIHGNYQHDITYGEETRSGFVRPGSTWPVAVDAACEIVGCPPGGFWARSAVRAHSDVNERQAHEVRLVSTTDNRLQWSVGAFSQDIENGDDPKSWMHCGALGPKHDVIYGGPEYPDITCQRNGLSFNPAMSLEQMRAVHRLLQQGLMRTGGAGYTVRDQQALFGEVSYALSDQWEILGGVRYAESSFGRIRRPERPVGAALRGDATRRNTDAGKGGTEGHPHLAAQRQRDDLRHVFFLHKAFGLKWTPPDPGRRFEVFAATTETLRCVRRPVQVCFITPIFLCC